MIAIIQIWNEPSISLEGHYALHVGVVGKSFINDKFPAIDKAI